MSQPCDADLTVLSCARCRINFARVIALLRFGPPCGLGRVTLPDGGFASAQHAHVRPGIVFLGQLQKARFGCLKLLDQFRRHVIMPSDTAHNDLQARVIVGVSDVEPRQALDALVELDDRF